MDIRVAPDQRGAAVLAADAIARRLRAALRTRPLATLAVSGATPAMMFEVLASRSLEWERVAVVQVDERVAPPGDPARNAEQLRIHLLARLARRPAAVVALPVDTLDLGDADRRLRALEPLDVVHLGVGDDGHTASWPPGDAAADAALDLADAVAMVRGFRGHDRLTLTPRVVNDARSRVVLATGAGKAGAIASWVGGDRSLPVARVRRTGTVVVLDVEAARSLRR
jgi:6-phosphogluconolactonase/glucosamine-6-phosphate isomerase/deaminase